jgi:DNA-binding transcriptional LysR family regulator
MPDADWDLFQSLHAVLEAGSFSGAAKLRGLTQPTLGRHIETLERKLGSPLFLRSPRGIQPTDLALELKPHLSEMAAAAEAAIRDASGAPDSLAGSVRITAAEVMGAEVLPAILAEFREQHPAIAIELTLSNANEDLLRREADIAVRMTAPQQAALVAKKVGEVRFGFYAHPSYLARHPAPLDLDDLERHSLIGFDRDPMRASSVPDLNIEVTRDVFALRTDNDVAQLAALSAGFGIGVAQHTIARRRGLTRVMPNLTVFSLGMWVCMHENLKGTRRMRLMFDHLVAGLSAYVAEGPH